MNNSNERPSFILRVLDKVYAFRERNERISLYIILPILVARLILSKQWDATYLFACPIVAFGIAYAYRKYGPVKSGETELDLPIQAYLLVLPAVFLLLVTYGYAIFGIDYKSKLYKISFVLVGIAALWLAAAGVFALWQAMRPKNCMKCEARGRFFLAKMHSKSPRTYRYCLTHFGNALHDVVTSYTGNYLFVEPAADHPRKFVDYSFYTYEDLFEDEYEDKDIETVKTLLGMVEQKNAGSGSYGAMFTRIPAEYMAMEDENGDTSLIFACEPSDMKLHHMNITEFKQWFGQFAAKINDTGGELHMDVPSAKAGIYLLE